MKTTTTTLLAVLFAGIAHADPASLYDELGGVHAIAAGVDAAVDLEVNDPVLLGNKRFLWLVENVGPAAQKFIVTNYLCAKTGGPQRTPFQDFPAMLAWIAFTPEETERAWELRMKGLAMAKVPKEAATRLRNWFEEHSAGAKPMEPRPEEFMDSTQLYARLGGFRPISMVVDSFVNELATDPTIMANPHVVASLTKGPATGAGIKYLVTEQLAAAAGGPFTYSGRDMKSSHSALMVSAKEWDAAAAILVRVLDKYKVPQKEQAEILAVVGSTRGDIVKK
jgi:hemoglobin